MECMRCGSAMTVVFTDKCILTDPPLRIVGVPINHCPECDWESTDPVVAKRVDSLRIGSEIDAVEAMRVVWYDRSEGVRMWGGAVRGGGVESGRG